MDDARPSDGTPFPVEREFLLYAEVQEIMVFRLRFIGQAKELRQLFLLGFPQQAAEKRKRGRRNQGDPRVCQTLAGLPQGVPKTVHFLQGGQQRLNKGIIHINTAVFFRLILIIPPMKRRILLQDPKRMLCHKRSPLTVPACRFVPESYPVFHDFNILWHFLQGKLSQGGSQ